MGKAKTYKNYPENYDPKKGVRQKIRPLKNRLLELYIFKNDILYRKELEKMSFNNIDLILKNYAKRNNIIITQINYESWKRQYIKK